MRSLLLATLITSTLGLGACDEDTDRYEKVAKLRALGVTTTPVIAQPSTADAPQAVTLTFHVALPLGETATIEPFTDDQAKYSLPAPVTIVAGSESYTEYGAFRLFSAQATAPIALESDLEIPADPGFLRFRYGVKITSGTEEEKIVGNFLVYPKDATETSWTAPAVDIVTPEAGAGASGDQDLKAAITNPIGEKMRVGWFVSDGKVKNRRAKETEWETPGAGTHTVLVTVRGLKSGAFAMKAMDVTVP